MGNKPDYILTIDQSTSATKAMLFNREGGLETRKNIPHKQYYPQAGFVEHDALEIFENTLVAIKEVIEEKGVDHKNLASISITNQRETALIWDKHTGQPVGHAAVWQCLRGTEICKSLIEKRYNELIREKTGLLIDPYFSASKLQWMMQNIQGLEEKAKNGSLLFGTMDSWLLWKLTNGMVHATDYSNACRTLLFNIHTLQWDDELIELFGLQRNMFPEVRYSDDIFGYTDPSVVFDAPVPIAGLMGDSHAALFGQNCFSTGMAKATYGTGSSIMMNIGTEPLASPEGLVTSIGYGLGKQIHYVFEGNIHCTGDTINWLKNEVGLIENDAETETLAKSVEDNNGVYLVPAFGGLGAPYWDNQARACLSGMPRNTTKSHIVRAALESIAFQVKDLISLMEGEGGIHLKELRVDGGPTRNDFLMQFQAGILGREVNRSSMEEISALGVTLMAGLATGFWKDIQAIEALRKAGKIFHPAMKKQEIEKLFSGWKKAVERARL